MRKTGLFPTIDADLEIPEFTEQLLELLLAQPVEDHTARTAVVSAHRPTRSRRVTVVALAGAIAVIVVAAALAGGARDIPGGGVGVNLSPTPASAAAVLTRSARAVQLQPPLREGERLRVRMQRGRRLGRADVTFTSWMAVDGAARFVVQPLDRAGYQYSDTRCAPRRCVIHSADMKNEPEGPAVYGPGPGFTAPQLQRLPTSPRSLLNVIVRQARLGGGVAAAPWRDDPWEAGFSLLVAPVQPDVRAALYRALATLHGVRVLGKTDVNGRVGVILSRRVQTSGPSIRRDIIVDPRTGALLAARAYVNGRLSDWRTYETSIVRHAASVRHPG